jgi:hypothetical protein
MRKGILVVSLALLFSVACFAQSNTDVYKVTSPIQTLGGEIGSNISDDSEPYKSGLIDPNQAVAILGRLQADKTKTTIIHLLRWDDEAHTKVRFQKWYLYDPDPSKSSFYLESKEKLFQSAAIPGRTDFQFIYIHLNAVLKNNEDEWKLATASGTTLKHPVSYSISVTKQQAQFIQDLKTVLQIVGVTAAAATEIKPGYFSLTTFKSEWETSGITITASLDSADKTQGKGTGQNTASNQLASNTYTNEKPSWIGLSAGVPITSYKSVTYQSTGGTLVPNSITKQDVYIFLDGYVPPVLPSLASFRFIPHPFFGVPIHGEVFRHTMFGFGIGLRWLEPFGGIVFDTQSSVAKGTIVQQHQLTYHGVFGLKVSISAVAKALKTK